MEVFLEAGSCYRRTDYFAMNKILETFGHRKKGLQKLNRDVAAKMYHRKWKEDNTSESSIARADLRVVLR